MELVWAQVGSNVMWLRRGVATVAELKTSAGNQFLIMHGLGWSGEPGWVPVEAIKSHLRPLKSAKVCERWLEQLRTLPDKRSAGDLVERRERHRRTVQFGRGNQQVVALAEAYAEAHRPDADDVELLELLERSVVAEIAAVLGRDYQQLRAELRARPRFRDDAPRSGTIVETPATGPDLPAGFEWFATFKVTSELHITDEDELSIRLPASAGDWHAARFEIDQPEQHQEQLLAWIATAHAYRHELPLQAESRRLAAVASGDMPSLGVLDGEALDDPVIAEEFRECTNYQLGDRGAATFWHRPADVHVWELGGRCIAVSLTMTREPDDS